MQIDPGLSLGGLIMEVCSWRNPKKKRASIPWFQDPTTYSRGMVNVPWIDGEGNIKETNYLLSRKIILLWANKGHKQPFGTIFQQPLFFGGVGMGKWSIDDPPGSLDHHFAANLRSQRSLHRAGVQHRPRARIGALSEGFAATNPEQNTFVDEFPVEKALW